MSSRSSHRARIAVLALASVVSAGMADVITVKNRSNAARTLSDLYAFPMVQNQGARTTILAKGDATDDINLGAGAVKNLVSPNGTRSFTISWMSGGREVEADLPVRPGIDVQLAMFSSPGFGGDIAVAFDEAPGPVPAEGFVGLVADGKIVDHPEFDWFTFFDTTDSDGFIVRDGSGNPTSPPLDGVSVEVAFNYDVLVPAPGSLALMGLGGLVAMRRRR